MTVRSGVSKRSHEKIGDSEQSTEIVIIIFVLCSPQEPNILAWIFEKFVIAMIVYFLLSIINSMAQHYAKRLDEKKRQSQKPAKGE